MRGVFTLSLDAELIWGSIDHIDPARFGRLYPHVRQINLDLLRLLERHEVRATWCVVGHLFLTDDSDRQGGTIGGIPWPSSAKSQLAPSGNCDSEPLWYASDLVEAIRHCAVTQEIGSHGFSHSILNQGMTETEFDEEIAACVALADRYGLSLKSFVFPRNIEAFHGVLARRGFTSYRGSDPVQLRGRLLRRAVRLASEAAAATPPTGRPTRHESGLWNVPASMFFGPRHGVRKIVPARSTLARALSGIRRAAEREEVFHLWFHPFNLSTARLTLFQLLSTILTYARELERRGDLNMLPMTEVVAAYEGNANHSSS